MSVSVCLSVRAHILKTIIRRNSAEFSALWPWFVPSLTTTLGSLYSQSGRCHVIWHRNKDITYWCPVHDARRDATNSFTKSVSILLRRVGRCEVGIRVGQKSTLLYCDRYFNG